MGVSSAIRREPIKVIDGSQWRRREADDYDRTF